MFTHGFWAFGGPDNVILRLPLSLGINWADALFFAFIEKHCIFGISSRLGGWVGVFLVLVLF